jgi:hypothetical protein
MTNELSPWRQRAAVAQYERERAALEQHLADGAALCKQAVEEAMALHRYIDMMAEPGSDSEFAARKLAENYERGAKYNLAKFMAGF